MVLKYGPLTPAAIPGLTVAFPQGMGAVVFGVVFKKFEAPTPAATNQGFGVVFRRGIDFIDHLSLQDCFGCF